MNKNNKNKQDKTSNQPLVKKELDELSQYRQELKDADKRFRKINKNLDLVFWTQAALFVLLLILLTARLFGFF